MSSVTEKFYHDFSQENFKSIDEVLQEVQGLAEVIFSNIQRFAIIIFNENLRYLYASGQALEENGYSAKDMVGKTIDEVLPKEALDVLKEVYLKTIQGKYSSFNHVSEGKTYQTTFIPSSIVKSKIGIILVQDITESEKTNAEYKEMNDRFTLASKGSRDGIWDWISIDDRKCWFSDQFYNLLGYSQEEFLATFDQFLEIFHPEDSVKMMDQLNKHFTNNSRFDLIVRLRTKKGYRWFRVLGQAKFDQQGTPLRMVGTISYKHELVSNTQKLRRNTKNLEEQKKQLKEIIYVASHDFKVPIKNMEGLLTLLDTSKIDKENLEIINRLKSNIQSLSNTTENLYEALEQNKEHDHFSEINVNAIIDEVIESMDEELISIASNIETVIEPNLYIHFSSFHLKSILSNLISNSIKYRNPEKPLLIQISANKSNQGIVIKVSDNGKGMNLSLMKDKMFRLFQQGDKENPGKGIGLFTVKSIIERNNGTIDVESEFGEGTVFTINLRNEE